MNKYFYTDGVRKFGPFSKEELRHQKISRRTKIWFYGMEKWTELSEIEELKDMHSSIPPDLNNRYSSSLNETPSIENQLNQEPPMPSIKNSQIGKWIIGSVLILFISILAYSIFQNKSEENFKNEIAASSYESDENFEMYVEKFYRDLEYHGIFPKKPKKKIIRLSRLDQLDNATHIHGVSFGGNDDDVIEIYINTSTWNNFNKPMRYFLMYHELAHDILNVEDLEATIDNEGKLMYPEISSYEKKNMDDFIESSHALFDEILASTSSN